jgi:hypothetical protein
MLEFGRPHCFADPSQRRSQSFFKRGMIEGKLQHFGRRLATLDRPGEQMRDVIHCWPKKHGGRHCTAIAVGVNSNKPAVAGVNLRAPLIGI